MTASFANKVVLVTGSSSGIGAATALAFAKEGALLTIHGRNQDALKLIADKIETLTSKKPVTVIGDLREKAVIEQLIQNTIERYGRLDVLVNNAGTISNVDHIEHPDFMDTYTMTLSVNLEATVRLTHLAIPELIKTKGNIVNVSSIASIAQFTPAYCMSKSALDQFTKCTASQLASKGVRVNSVNPGPVKTNIIRGVDQKVMDINLMAEMFKDVTPLKFFADGDDIAPQILFLADNTRARNVTGSILISDTGCLVNPIAMAKLLSGGQDAKQ